MLLSEEIYQNLEQQQWELISPEILKQLIEFKFVVPTEENELQIIIDENKNSIQDSQLLYFVIQPTAFCQLGCDYCGQDHAERKVEN